MQERRFLQASPCLGADFDDIAHPAEAIFERDDEKIKNELFLELMPHLTNAQILYGKVDDLIKIKSKLNDTIKRFNFNYEQNEPEINEKIKELLPFLLKHAALVGRKQAIIDLQRGLSLLNKNRRKSPCIHKNILLQDGIYKNKTYGCLCDVCRNYKVKTIIKYIKKGILNNIIFDTKNRKNVDTNALIKKVYLNLKGME